MALQSIGDMSRHFVSLRQGAEIRTRLAASTRELSSGRSADLTAHLRSDLKLLNDLDRKLALNDSYSMAARETGQVLQVMQISLDGISQTRGDLANQLALAVAGHESGALRAGVGAAKSGFESIVQSLNVGVGGQSLFGGVATGRSALVGPDEMLAALTSTIAGVTTASGLAAAVDDWFDAPLGGFFTSAYQGDTAATLARRIDVNVAVDIDARADDPVLRDLMKAAAIAALAGDSTVALPDHERRDAIRLASQRLFAGGEPLANLQGRLGVSEARVEETRARQVAQKTAFSIMRNDLTLSDPYDTSIKLMALEQQLETHYTLTARLSRLSLAEYMR